MEFGTPREQSWSLRAVPAGHLALHVGDCRCKPTISSTKVLQSKKRENCSSSSSFLIFIQLAIKHVSVPPLYRRLSKNIFSWGSGRGALFPLFCAFKSGWVGNLYPVLSPSLLFGIFITDLYVNRNSSQLALNCDCVVPHHVPFFCALPFHFLQPRNPWVDPR